MPPTRTFTYDDLGRPAEWAEEINTPVGKLYIRQSMWISWKERGFTGQIQIQPSGSIAGGEKGWFATKLVD